MGYHSQIRGSFVRGYAERHREYVKTGWEMIAKRDNEHRTLNRAYGYVDADGTVGIGCKSHVDIEYKRKYDEIESRFREPYDRNLPSLYDWCKQDSMTIFEYLLIDNLYDEHLDTIATECVKKEDWQIDFLGRKASLFVEKLKADYSVGDQTPNRHGSAAFWIRGGTLSKDAGHNALGVDEADGAYGL